MIVSIIVTDPYGSSLMKSNTQMSWCEFKVTELVAKNLNASKPVFNQA